MFDLAERRLIDRELTDKAKGFISRNAKAGRPFFAFIPYTMTLCITYSGAAIGMSQVPFAERARGVFRDLPKSLAQIIGVHDRDQLSRGVEIKEKRLDHLDDL